MLALTRAGAQFSPGNADRWKALIYRRGEGAVIEAVRGLHSLRKQPVTVLDAEAVFTASDVATKLSARNPVITAAVEEPAHATPEADAEPAAAPEEPAAALEPIRPAPGDVRDPAPAGDHGEPTGEPQEAAEAAPVAPPAPSKPPRLVRPRHARVCHQDPPHQDPPHQDPPPPEPKPRSRVRAQAKRQEREYEKLKGSRRPRPAPPAPKVDNRVDALLQLAKHLGLKPTLCYQITGRRTCFALIVQAKA